MYSFTVCLLDMLSMSILIVSLHSEFKCCNILANLCSIHGSLGWIVDMLFYVHGYPIITWWISLQRHCYHPHMSVSICDCSGYNTWIPWQVNFILGWWYIWMISSSSLNLDIGHGVRALWLLRTKILSYHAEIGFICTKMFGYDSKLSR